MTAADVALVRAPALGRLTAVLTLASVTVHSLLLDVASLGSLVMLGLAAACLPCAVNLWRAPTPRVWTTTATIDVAMLAVHAQSLAGGMPGMHHAPSPLVWSGLALVTGQLLLAGTAAARR